MTTYFINQYLLSQNSSVEHAEIARVKLFTDHQSPAKIVTRDFDPVLHLTIAKFGLSDQQIVNMFDFFAGTTAYQGDPLGFDDWNNNPNYQVSTGNNVRTFTDGDILVGEVHFAPGLVAKVQHVDYFDAAGNLTLRSQYDVRGFKTADEFFGQDGQMHYQALYRPDHSKYMERYYVKSTENTPINSLNRLIGYRGRDWLFDSIDDLFIFFLDELNKSDGEKNTFIADRPAMANAPVMAMGSKVRKLLWLPINHVVENTDSVTGLLSGVYGQAFSDDGLKQLDGLVVMTAAQQRDLTVRLNGKIPVYQVSGGIAASDKQVAMKDRIQNRIIHVGRLGWDKQIDQVLQVFKQIHAKVSDATLVLYGYGDGGDVEKFKQQVVDLKLDEPGLVTFAGYQVDLGDAYDQAQLYLDCARIDGQPLSLVEGLGHGIPALSYDYLYGPNELIEDGKNGQLLPVNDVNAMAQAAVQILQDSAQLQEMSNQAYQLSQNYDADHVWQQWQRVAEYKDKK